MFELDLNSKENLYLFSPRIAQSAKEALRDKLKSLGLDSHIFILSSGSTSTGELKGYALSKEAVAANADSVNRHLELGGKDAWHLSLPHWHIGGLSVFARAALAGSQVIQKESKWDVRHWRQDIEGAAVTSVVPLQAFDIVKEKLSAPSSLKHIIVGGDLLSSELHASLVSLGWPVLRTFGMTEVCSQLATEKAPSKKANLQILDIHQAKANEVGELLVKSKAIFSGLFRLDDKFIFQPASEFMEGDFYKTSDLAMIEGNALRHLGRNDQAFKSKGRLFFFNELRGKLADFALTIGVFGEVELMLKNDERSGKRADIVATEKTRSAIEAKWDELCELLAPLPLDGPVFVQEIKRTELGKLKLTSK